ncbi:AAA family ATPase [Aestuariivirga sp.]|uniref:AAA family ATPase n=1 Tax=Aestuariivirga sp. TaxID=2650926 RepID=UPI003BAD7660
MPSQRRDPIIEFVGVPGAGKSTIARALREIYPGLLGPQVPRAPFRADARLLAAAAGLFLSLRPLAANDPNRFAKLIEAHYVYQHGLAAPLLLEQGLVQRLWSAVADRTRYSPERLAAFARLLAGAGPDVIIWVSVRPEVAAARIHARPRGNSRYERMDEAEIIRRLGPAAELYATLVSLYRQHSPAAILELSSDEPVAANVERAAQFLRRALPQLKSRA